MGDASGASSRSGEVRGMEEIGGYADDNLKMRGERMGRRRSWRWLSVSNVAQLVLPALSELPLDPRTRSWAESMAVVSPLWLVPDGQNQRCGWGAILSVVERIRAGR